MFQISAQFGDKVHDILQGFRSSRDRRVIACQRGEDNRPADLDTSFPPCLTSCMGARFSLSCATFETKAGPFWAPNLKIKKSLRMVLPWVTENPYSKLELKHFSRYGEI